MHLLASANGTIAAANIAAMSTVGTTDNAALHRPYTARRHRRPHPEAPIAAACVVATVSCRTTSTAVVCSATCSIHGRSAHNKHAAVAIRTEITTPFASIPCISLSAPSGTTITVSKRFTTVPFGAYPAPPAAASAQMSAINSA